MSNALDDFLELAGCVQNMLDGMPLSVSGAEKGSPLGNVRDALKKLKGEE